MSAVGGMERGVGVVCADEGVSDKWDSIGEGMATIRRVNAKNNKKVKMLWDQRFQLEKKVRNGVSPKIHVDGPT